MFSQDPERIVKEEIEDPDDLSWISEKVFSVPAKKARFPWLSELNEDLEKYEKTEQEMSSLKKELETMKQLKETAEETARENARKLLESEKKLFEALEREKQLMKSLGELEVEATRLQLFVQKIIDDNE